MEGRVAYFEELCSRVAGGGDVPAQRELVALRETGSPETCLAIGRAVLDKTASGATPASPALVVCQFEALSLLEAAVLRSPTNALAVLRYVLGRAAATSARQPRAVTRKHLHVAAAVYKRCFQATRVENPTDVDCSPSEFREALWSVLAAWLAEGQPWETRLLGAELLKSVFGNFVIAGSRSLGLTIDYHYRCHCAFEELYLRQVFHSAQSLIEQAMAVESPAPVMLATLRTAVEIIVDLLQWNWNATVSLSTYIWAAVRSLNERTTVSASEEWSLVIRQPFLFDMFGALYRRFRRSDEEIGRLALRGLEQMASFLVHDKPSAAVVQLRPPFVELLLGCVTGLLGAVTSEQHGRCSPGELLAVSGIVARMAANQHVKLLMLLPNWASFLQSFGLFTELTCTRLLALASRASGAAGGDGDGYEVEQSREMASFSNALHAWSIFGKYAVYRTATDTVQRQDHPDPQGPGMAALKESLGLVYQMYVRTRLQCASTELLAGGLAARQLPRPKPRAVEAESGSVGSGEDSNGIVEEEVADQLSDAALCGRAHLKTAVPLLGTRLRGAQAALAGLEGAAGAGTEERWLQAVEELHWLLLMAGHLLADATEWEHNSSIPRIVSQYETQSRGHVVQLVRTVFSLLDWEAQCHVQGRKHLLSPLLSATVLWFSDRIIRTYFFRVKRPSDGVAAPYPRQDVTADSFVTAFHSLPLFNQFVERIAANLQQWSGSDEVLVPTCRLLRSCCSINRLSYRLTSLPAYSRLLSSFGQWTLDQVHSPHHRKVVAAICMARVSDNSAQCEAYTANVLATVGALMSKIGDPSFAFGDSGAVKFCATVLEKLNGIVDGTITGNCVQIRHFFFGCLAGFQKLMEVYKSDSTLYVPLVRLCTRFVASQSESCPVWTTVELDRMFDMSLAVIKFCRSGALLTAVVGSRWSRQQERDQYQLVRRLILLLIALLQLVSASGAANTNRESQVDVIYFGLGALLTHISEQLLDYPKLKLSYFRLLKRLLNMYPERFGLLPPDLFTRLMTTLLFAVKTADEKVQLCAIKGLKSLFNAHARYGVLRQQQAMSSALVAQLIQAAFALLMQQRSSQPALLPAAALLLRNLVASDRAAFTTAVQALAAAAGSPGATQHVLRAASTLMDRVNLAVFDREQEELFRENVKAFVLETRGMGPSAM